MVEPTYATHCDCCPGSLELGDAHEELACVREKVASITKKLAKAELESVMIDELLELDEVLELVIALQEAVDSSNSLQNFQFESCGKVASHNSGLASGFSSCDVRTAARMVKQAKDAKNEAYAMVEQARVLVTVSDLSVQHLMDTDMGANHGKVDGATVFTNYLQEESDRDAERNIKMSSFLGTGFDTTGF